MVKHYGWKGRKGKGRDKQQRAVRVRRSVRVRKARVTSRWFMGYAARLRRKGFSLAYVIRFYRAIDGVDSPSSTEITRWYKTRWHSPGHRASTPDTLILESGSESQDECSSDGEGRAPFQSPSYPNNTKEM